MRDRSWIIPEQELARISNWAQERFPDNASSGEQIELLLNSGLFDSSWYLSVHPDVAASGMDPAAHYILHGADELRDPAQWFNAGLYAGENPDALMSIKNPFIHYLCRGWKEGRRPNQHCKKAIRRLIVSLTSWAPRIRAVDQAIRSILRQTMRADKIILWLSEDEFPLREKQLPLSLLELAGRGLEIRWCENLGPYKKLVPALREYPEDIIITSDDDIEHEEDWLEKLWHSYQRRPGCVSCHRATKIIFGEGEVKWIAGGREYYRDPSFLNKQTGCKGVLYPSHILDTEAVNESEFTRLAPSSDDIWFWVMGILNGAKVAVCENHNLDLKHIGNTQSVALCKTNDGPGNFFERHLQNVFFHYRHRLEEVLGINIYEQFLPKKVKRWYANCLGKELNFSRCETYNEKLQWLKIYDDDPLKAALADKYLARAYVGKHIGEQYLPKLHGVWDKFEFIDFNKLPDRFVLKANHGCAWNILVKDKAQFDREEARIKFSQWLNSNFAFHEGFETHYFDIRPRIICEEYLDHEADSLNDFKVFCFHGKAEYIMFLADRGKGLKMAFYDRNWRKLDIRYSYPPYERPVPRPERLDLLLALAERLAADFPHVRVDFYILRNGEIKFGEFTFSSASGVCKWVPDEADLILGGKFSLPGRTPQA